MSQIFHALSESHLISWHDMYYSIRITSFYWNVDIYIYICECVQANIACAFRG